MFLFTVYEYNLFHAVIERKHPIKKKVTRQEFLKSMQYDVMRKKLELFALKEKNFRLQNRKLKLEIYGLKRG